jgi:hypothetical protein
MKNQTLKLGVMLLALTVVVPESYAKRLGGGRSSGRQSQMSRQRMAPPPTVVRPRPSPPYARPGPGPRVAPYATRPGYGGQQIPQQTGSRWGGMVGGALLGLGLGSLMSNGHAHEDAARLEAARQEGVRQEAARQEAVRQEAAKDEAARKESSANEATSKEPVPKEWENLGPTDVNKSSTKLDSASPVQGADTSGNW